MPAQQRLEAGHRAVGGGDLRLVVQLELALLDPAGEVAAQQPSGPGLARELRPVVGEPGPSRRLRAVERDVGVGAQLVRRAAIVGIERDPDARADHQILLADADRLGRRRHQPLRQDRGVGGGAQLDLDHRELVAAEPGDRVAAAHRGGQALGDDAQKLVARTVAQRVVDLLEPVEVEVEKREAPPRPCGDRQGLDQPVLEQAPVGQAGQGIVVRQMLDAVARLLGPGEQSAGVADLAPQQIDEDARAADQAGQGQPADRAQLAQVPLHRAVRFGRAVEQFQHDRLQRRGLGVERGVQGVARGRVAARDAVGVAFEHRLQSAEEVGGARHAAEWRRIGSRPQGLEPAPEQIEPADHLRRARVIGAVVAVERVQQTLELEACLEDAPARLGGTFRQAMAEAQQAALDQHQAGGEDGDGGDEQPHPEQPGAAARVHVTSIWVSCQIERCRCNRSSRLR